MFKWTEQWQHALDLLKHKLTSAPVLAHPDYSLPFILDTDASDVGIGAVLSQRHPDGKEYVIAYHSRALTKSERQYSVTRREFLAVVTFCRHFAHTSSAGILHSAQTTAHYSGFTTSELDFTVIHRQGKSHANADTLSRNPSHTSHTTQPPRGAVEPDTEDSIVIACASLPLGRDNSHVTESGIRSPVCYML